MQSAAVRPKKFHKTQWVMQWRHCLWWVLAPDSSSFSFSYSAPTFTLTTHPEPRPLTQNPSHPSTPQVNDLVRLQLQHRGCPVPLGPVSFHNTHSLTSTFSRSFGFSTARLSVPPTTDEPDDQTEIWRRASSLRAHSAPTSWFSVSLLSLSLSSHYVYYMPHFQWMPWQKLERGLQQTRFLAQLIAGVGVRLCRNARLKMANTAVKTKVWA